MENFVIKMDANINNPNLQVLTNVLTFKLKKPNAVFYPITANGDCSILNVKLETKSGNNIFSRDGVTYTNSISSINTLYKFSYIQLTQEEEIEATILNPNLKSNISIANFTNNIAIDISLDTIMYFETFGSCIGNGSIIRGTSIDLWNPNIESINIFADIFENNIDVSDYFLFNNGTLVSWYVASNKVTFDLKKLDENPLYNEHVFNFLSDVGKGQMIYTGAPTDIITWGANMHFFTFKNAANARNWFLSLGNSPFAISTLKNVRINTNGTFIWDSECLAVKQNIINILTQDYINSCTNFTFFNDNWKQ